MHELALMEELRRLAVQEARAQGASRIHRLRLRIGSQAGVDPEALRQAFAVVMGASDPQGQPEDAELCGRPIALDLDVVPTVCFCPDCAQEFHPADVIHACPRCGALASRILRGRELELVGLEVS
ncbi:hydrogenase maturation nickel metallochaperone HypA [Vulcanococcus limneticus]|uniref:hydrogenase maturation nickel metallochaperone HypA/HybF n=1 Tax=Vulcanococcus limneticus TaxID=2170428 RepID=UPI000B9904E0|nr:hydrogenase maturation nickel metallochaperone HypA [Vulcanococcus limneticus]MCP9792151.1 hydrogenase maturation nickel metallochaperone HypA [Vulcanococcus limneticus MW73D5]MCP9893955.1 hydrogenase maturation nickel metallochaperone HypA [Vulcanococcus limneticus Candia 3F8]MCP9897547.1 hydrogenase maturation nickel metallochaperone HypA [Vulcanococcus limneticus Candia 3B3]